MSLSEDSSTGFPPAGWDDKPQGRSVPTQTGSASGDAAAQAQEPQSTPSTDDPAVLVEQLREWISRLLQLYAVFFADYKPILEMTSVVRQAESRIKNLQEFDTDVRGEVVMRVNIEARTEHRAAIRDLIALKSVVAMPAQILGEKISQFEVFYSAISINSDSSVELRALRKQCDVVAAQLRSAITDATSEIALLPERSEPEKEKVASRYLKVATLKENLVRAYDAHQQAKVAYQSIADIRSTMRGYHYHDRIEEPRKPSAEEVLQFIENWSARKSEFISLERDAYAALAEYNRAMAVLRTATIAIKEALYRLPASAKLAFDEEYSVVRQAEKLQEFIFQIDNQHHLLGNWAKIERRKPPVLTVPKPEKEKELEDSLRELNEMLAYCVGARNFAQGDLYNAKQTPEPVAPDPADFDTGDGYAHALKAYRQACSARRSMIWRKESVVQARVIQLDAVVARLSATVERCLQLNEATDALLVPFEVAEAFVSLFKREERRHDD